MRPYLGALLAFVLLTGAALAALVAIDDDDAPRAETLPVARAPVTRTATPSPTATSTATATPLPPPPTLTPEPAATPPPAVQSQPPRANERFDPGFAAAVLAGINAERAARGLAPLASDAALSRSAAGYAQLLVQQGALSHTAGGTTVLERARSAGYAVPTPLGEVIWKLTGVAPPERAVSDWLASPVHRDAILSPRYRVAGAGCYFRQAERQQARCVVDLGA